MMIPFTPRSCRITDKKMMFCDVPKAQMPLAILNIGFARRAAFVWVHSNLIGITQTVDTVMHAISKYNKLKNLSCVSYCKAPQDRPKNRYFSGISPAGPPEANFQTSDGGR